MPWSKPRPPDLGELLQYIVGRSRDREATLTRTKLLKLAYLVDISRAESVGKPLTGLRWRFLHYGPYAPELGVVLASLEDSGALLTSPFGDAVLLYRGATSRPDSENWPPSICMTVDHVVDEWAGGGSAGVHG